MEAAFAIIHNKQLQKCPIEFLRIPCEFLGIPQTIPKNALPLLLVLETMGSNHLQTNFVIGTFVPLKRDPN